MFWILAENQAYVRAEGPRQLSLILCIGTQVLIVVFLEVPSSGRLGGESMRLALEELSLGSKPGIPHHQVFPTVAVQGCPGNR